MEGGLQGDLVSVAIILKGGSYMSEQRNWPIFQWNLEKLYIFRWTSENRDISGQGYFVIEGQNTAKQGISIRNFYLNRNSLGKVTESYRHWYCLNTSVTLCEQGNFLVWRSQWYFNTWIRPVIEWIATQILFALTILVHYIENFNIDVINSKDLLGNVNLW